MLYSLRSADLALRNRRGYRSRARTGIAAIRPSRGWPVACLAKPQFVRGSCLHLETHVCVGGGYSPTRVPLSRAGPFLCFLLVFVPAGLAGRFCPILFSACHPIQPIPSHPKGLKCSTFVILRPCSFVTFSSRSIARGKGDSDVWLYPQGPELSNLNIPYVLAC